MSFGLDWVMRINVSYYIGAAEVHEKPWRMFLFHNWSIKLTLMSLSSVGTQLLYS